MSKDNPGKALLENAYRLQSPEDNVAYYNKLAEIYDEDFADSLGYALPEAVAQRFLALRSHSDSPVMDVGCGTGLLAAALNQPDLIIDGLDISDAMLDIAREKQQYRDLFEIDLSKPLNPSLKNYGAVLSSGTFTHGHVGPDAMVRLLDIASNGALFVLSVNKEYYSRLGFEAVSITLENENQIHDLSLDEFRIYSTTGHEHSDDLGLIVSFRKT